MDSFLFIGDYAKQIEANTLTQLTGGNTSILQGVQRAAVEECISYLKQKYDTTLEFENTTQHNRSLSYLAENTVYLNANTYDQTATYAINAYTLYNGSVYQCSTAITIPEAFNPTKWALLGLQYDLYNAVVPYPIFNIYNYYNIGDKVFWRNSTYTCKIATQAINHDAALAIGQAIDYNVINVFPDDKYSGVQYWGTPTAYTVPANTSLLNTTYWANFDNRDQKLLMVCVAIALYHLHFRISPKNIPDAIIHRYIGDSSDRYRHEDRILYPTYSALGWLQAANIGTDITPELPLLQPRQGARLRFGGHVKLNNTYFHNAFTI
jgi:hypothetical protein